MTETGGIKFQAQRVRQETPVCPFLPQLNVVRAKLLALGLIGKDAKGIGFGNISVRIPGQHIFFITVSGSSDLELLERKELVLISDWDCHANTVDYDGPGIPSAETLTHAAIYGAEPSAGAVLHVHHQGLWLDLVQRNDATEKSAEYGTTAMAGAVEQFVDRRKGLTNVFAMRGHDGGILAFGGNLDDALRSLMAFADDLPLAG